MSFWTPTVLDKYEYTKYQTRNPSSALKEIARVASKYLIVLVPSEPFFMLGNLMRGKNILQCGNDQDHVNHWNKRTFHKYLSEEVNVNKITTSFPWLIALCSK